MFVQQPQTKNKRKSSTTRNHPPSTATRYVLQCRHSSDGLPPPSHMLIVGVPNWQAAVICESGDDVNPPIPTGTWCCATYCGTSTLRYSEFSENTQIRARRSWPPVNNNLCGCVAPAHPVSYSPAHAARIDGLISRTIIRCAVRARLHCCAEFKAKLHHFLDVISD